jgi:NAD-dependent SIR2 family protein deacetylase
LFSYDCGGVGVEGNIGREEPVAVSMEQIVNREGLGLNTADGMKYFRQNIKEVVENYGKSDTQEDLAFTSDFTKEERAYIHTISQRLGLKSLSRKIRTHNISGDRH